MRTTTPELIPKDSGGADGNHAKTAELSDVGPPRSLLFMPAAAAIASSIVESRTKPYPLHSPDGLSMTAWVGALSRASGGPESRQNETTSDLGDDISLRGWLSKHCSAPGVV